MTEHGRTSIVGLLTCAALLVGLPASAQDVPRSYIASPDVYKVIAENGKTKVILATWPPGKRDNWRLASPHRSLPAD